ncbi:S-adenosyl-L-methionine-dependent methyltransferase [Schizophyllum commune]
MSAPPASPPPALRPGAPKPPRTFVSPTVASPPLVSLAEGNAAFNNLHFWGIIVATPWLVKAFVLPLLFWPISVVTTTLFGFQPTFGFKTYLLLFALLGFPVAVAYWWVISKVGPRLDEKVPVERKPLEEFFEIRDAAFAEEWKDKKVPMQILHDAYFDGKVDFKGDVLETLEHRQEFASFEFTYELFRYVFCNFFPEVIMHSQNQDENQIRDNYDRGNDFYYWFLGPRMIYTSGVIRDPTRKETLEELQDNKLQLVCEKLGLKPGETLLDIGCGWGTLTAYAAKNYGVDATGVTLAREQAAFGTERIAKAGLTPEQARILCHDYREIPAGKKFDKIVSLEMAEHVGVRRYHVFLNQVYNLLEDDGTFFFQVSGIRARWQFEDLVWGLFMNKYVFPGADASCALGWVINKLEQAGFEVKSVDVLGCHYSATLWRWYENWLANKEKVLAKYGERWFRVWAFFLAWSVIASRQGSASLFQITLHKNLNAYPRVEGIASQHGIHVQSDHELVPINDDPEF